jgi:hypothetical protein
MLGGLLLQSLLYADDLMLLADSADQLQMLLNCLHAFSQACHMTVNIEKSKVVIFNNRDHWAGSMLYAGSALPIVKEFVYLGTRFYDAGNLHGNVRKNSIRNLAKAKVSLNAMKQRCRQMNMCNVMVQCDLFNALVASVINFGSEVWGVYHMHNLDNPSVAWGSGGEAEMMHRIFLRSIFQVRPRTTGAALMTEARRSPIMHSWFKLSIGWWNRIVARSDSDIVKQALKENIQDLAFGGIGVGALDTTPDKCWGSSFYSMVHAVQPILDVKVHNLNKLPVSQVMQTLHDRWHNRVWDRWVEVPIGSVSVRSVPEDDTNGFKKATYRSWFCPGSLEKGEGFAYHLHTSAQIKALATFRMSSHDLNIELMRHAPNRRPRSMRLCRCCNSGSREDELHILECEAYLNIRLDFADIFTVPFGGNPDAYMMYTMNPGHNGHAWHRLADFLIRVMAKRKAILDGLN